MSVHDSHEEEHELEDQNSHNHYFEYLAAHHTEALDREPVDVVEQLVVLAELQELKVGELDNLERGLRAGRSIVHEGRIPRGDDKIVCEVRDPMAEYLVTLLAAEWRALRPAAPMQGQQNTLVDWKIGRLEDCCQIEDW